MQAVTTKFLPVTNAKGARIVVRSQAKRIVVHWDDGCDVYDNHERAARSLLRQLGWLAFGEWVGGALPDDTGYAFVCVGKGGK